MEQRSLRLGDIVDDYCPRERRLTNHVVVALVGETIKQTRCSTCDAEHVYKGARVPSRKKKNESPEVETAVLASVNGTQLVARIERPDRGAHGDPTEAAPRQARQDRHETTPEPHPQKPAGTTPDTGAGSSHQHEHDKDRDEPGADQLPGGWVGHRTLIRATLPRTENDPPPPRPIPEFTMHQRQPRGGQGFRGGQGWGGRGGGGGGPRGNFSFGSGGAGNGHSGPERNGNVNGNSGGFGNGQGHRQGGGPPSPRNDPHPPPGA